MIYSLTDVLNESLPDLRNIRLKPVSVAVIDTGVDSSHEVLRKCVYGAWEFIDKDGEIVERSLPLRSNNDDAGHGTAVASIIAKIAPNARILDFKVLNANFSGTGKVMMAGLRAAINSDAKIINMSLACLAKYKDELSSLLEEAYKKHKIVIASKRNVPKVDDLGFPAELSSCISVENHSYDNNPFFIEHIDEQPIEFAAHGENILVAENGGGYYRLTGTSFATPTVSGNVALLLGKFPGLELYEIKSVLKYHSQQKSFFRNTPPNPLEIAKGGHHAKSKKSNEVFCPKCMIAQKTHEAFSLVKCSNCGEIFSVFPRLNKKLYDEVIRQLTCHIPNSYTYHNVQHTKDVIASAYRFSLHYSSISEKSRKCLLTAALLHDYGYKVQYENNTPIAADYAKEILPEYGYSESEICHIQSLIIATEESVTPETLLEKILRDADVSHIGSVLYREKSSLLLQEFNNLGYDISDEQWIRQEIVFLSQHKFSQKWLENERKGIKTDEICKLKRGVKKKFF